MPRTWTEAEIVELIECEIVQAQCDARANRGTSATLEQIGQGIYAKLRDNHLIEHTP